MKYINTEPNYWSSTTKQLPVSIKYSSSALSSADKGFNDFVTWYQGTLEKPGYKRKLKHQRKYNYIQLQLPFGWTHHAAKM